MYRAVYNMACFYWAILDDNWVEIDWAATPEHAKELVEKYNNEKIEKEKGK